jgi:AraC-like DNA-binding protein
VGSFGKAISQSLTVYDAINTLNRLYKRISSVARFSIVEDDEEIWWFRERLFDADVGSRQMELYSFGHMINLVRMGAGSAWRPVKMCVELDSISRLDQLEAFGDAEIQRRRGVSGFAIPRSVLSRRMPSQTPAASDRGDRFFADAPSTEFVGSLRQTLRSFVRIGHPRIETIAEVGGAGVRTLQRRLQAEGLTFKTVVDQARFQVAADLMGEKDLTLVEIAQELSYTDQAHFTHAFRRWAGVSPGRYRSQRHSI